MSLGYKAMKGLTNGDTTGKDHVNLRGPHLVGLCPKVNWKAVESMRKLCLSCNIVLYRKCVL